MSKESCNKQELNPAFDFSEELARQKQEQPSPSKWAVEAARIWNGDPDYGPLEEKAFHREENHRLATRIQAAISSALAEQAKVLGEVENVLAGCKGELDGLQCAYRNASSNRGERLIPADSEDYDRAQALLELVSDALAKLRSLKR